MEGLMNLYLKRTALLIGLFDRGGTRAAENGIGIIAVQVLPGDWCCTLHQAAFPSNATASPSPSRP